jgi:hypothetical protein
MAGGLLPGKPPQNFDRAANVRGFCDVDVVSQTITDYIVYSLRCCGSR